MKLPPKFALVLLPVTLVHLVVIVFFGAAIRSEEGGRGVAAGTDFATSGANVPGYLPINPGMEESGHGSPSLFPENWLESSVALPGYAAGVDPEPVAPEVVRSEAATIFPFDEAATKRKRAELPAEEGASQKEVEVKATQPRPGEPARRVRGFRPIGTKKAT